MKIKTSYDKLEKQLNEPARDYNTIKELVESQENSITNIKNKNIINKDIPILPKQKTKNKNKKKNSSLKHIMDNLIAESSDVMLDSMNYGLPETAQYVTGRRLVNYMPSQEATSTAPNAGNKNPFVF